MASFVTEFKHLVIQLEDIILATNNFDESKVIGRGGFGKVYAGELSHSQSGEKSLVAIKRLDRRYGQGDTEFFKEIRMLSCYRHENLISLLGFCCQAGEMILIYEYVSGGSLDRLLSSAALTWTKRLGICIDAAKGLSFLHDPNGTQQRVLHCDIKSSNILLDENMTAKVSDFGLSKMGPANQQYSLLITGALGTPGYCDPVFMETYSLSKESDVYSFGVVLIEILSGKLCVEKIGCELKLNVPSWKKSYDENKLNAIIMQDLMQQMDPSSLKTFSDIAFQCLRKAREERPTMSRVLEELEIALESQEFPDLRLEMLTKHEDILKAADPLLTYVYKTGSQLKELLCKGLINSEGKKWLSINEKGEHSERIYIEECLIPCQSEDLYTQQRSLINPSDYNIVNSRFPGGKFYDYRHSFKAGVRGQYLTPHISYTLNLVFQYEFQWFVNSNDPLRYKVDGEAKVFTIYPTIHEREDGWFVVPLYHFTSQHKTAEFEFEKRNTPLRVSGMEFQPSEEKVELQVFEEFQYIIEDASQSIAYRSLEELKQILRIGIHLKDYKTWFSLNEKGQHCHMISMKDCLIPNEDFTPRYQSHHQSRFPEGVYDTEQKGFRTHIKTQLLNPLIPYTVNLVFYIDSFDDQAYVDLKYRVNGEKRTSTVYLAIRINGRGDYSYMAELYQVTSNRGLLDLEIDFENPGINIQGVEGILFKPLEKVEDQVLNHEKVEDILPILDSDSEEIIKLSNHSVEGKTKKELYSMLCQGILIDNGQQWFTLDKNGKKCQMLWARATCVIDEKNSTWESSNESRFGEVLVIAVGFIFELVSDIKPTTLSPDTKYACYLVYKLPQDQSAFESPLAVSLKSSLGNWYNECIDSYYYLVIPPNTPVIGKTSIGSSFNPLNRHKLNTLPQQRSDGWMEVKVRGFETKKTLETVSMKLKLEHPVKKDLCGLIIQGIEIRPI